MLPPGAGPKRGFKLIDLVLPCGANYLCLILFSLSISLEFFLASDKLLGYLWMKSTLPLLDIEF